LFPLGPTLDLPITQNFLHPFLPVFALESQSLEVDLPAAVVVAAAVAAEAVVEEDFVVAGVEEDWEGGELVQVDAAEKVGAVGVVVGADAAESCAVADIAGSC
jgi:hypothetical protein